MKVVFLDIDGVLNYLNYFKKINDIRLKYNKQLKEESYFVIKKLIQIDFEKLYLLKEICDITNCKVVVTSSWRILDYYPLIEDYLINFGIPIIDTTNYIHSNRGLEIKTYLSEHKEITNYIILDDDIFPDYDEELLGNLIHTNFYNEGLDQDNQYDAIYKLKN